MRKLTKFFIICAAVCVAGIVMTFAGYAAGGVDDMAKVEENHSWFNIGPQNMEDEVIKVGEYDSIQTEGNADIAIVGAGFAGELDGDFEEHWIEKAYNQNLAGNVLILWKEGTAKPEVKVEKGVLIIHSSAQDPDVEVNLSDEDASPKIVVFYNGDKLKNIEIKSGYGDIAVGGVQCDDLNVALDSGDIGASEVKGGKLTFTSNAGDIALTDCEGDITAEASSGDIEFDSRWAMGQYDVFLQANTGDVMVNDADDDRQEFSSKGGPNKLTLKTDVGDISAHFWDAETEED